MSDSVGKISLDLEVKSDLQGQINKISSNIAKGLKNSLQGVTKGIFNELGNGIKKATGNINKAVGSSIAKLKKGMQNTLSAFKNIKINTPKVSFKPSNDKTTISSPVQKVISRAPPNNNDSEQLTTKISSTEKELDIVNRQIENQKAKLSQLQQSYKNAFSESKKSKIEEQMLRTEAAINRLITKSDNLGFKLNTLDSQLNNTSSGLNNVANNTSQSSRKINNASKKVGLLRKALNGLKNSADVTANRISNMGDIIESKFKKIYKYAMTLLGIKMGIKGVRAVGKYLRETFAIDSELMTNINQFKTNLMVAFIPIYNFILPALRALTSELATLSAMFASLINNLFGTTYKASIPATQAIIDAKDAMGVYGNKTKDATKKTKDLKAALAGFDEINQLTKDNKDDNDEGTSKAPKLDTSSFNSSMDDWAAGVKQKLLKLLEPVFAAWRKEGEKTINAIKYALSSVWDLIRSIGKSFEEVWLNGTGQRTCELILQILQNIFNIIGDIAKAFSNAWNKNNIGTKIVQQLWNGFNNLLTIVKGVGDAFRNVFEKIGESVADHFIGVLESMSGLFEHLTDCLRKVWDNGGKYCFEQILEVAGRVFDILSDIVSDVVKPMAEAVLNILTPALEGIFKVIGFILEQLNKVLEWVDGDGRGILDFIGEFGGALFIAWGVVEAGIKIFETAKKAIEGVKLGVEILGGAFSFLTSPIGIAIAAIGAIIFIGYELCKHWDTVKQKAQEVWQGIKDTFNTFKDWLKGVFANDWTNQFGALGVVFNGFFSVIGGVVKGLFGVFKGLIDFIAVVFTGDWGRAWKGVVEIFKGIFQGLGSILKAPINAVIALINGAISGLNALIKGANNLPGIEISTIPKVPYLAKGGIVDTPTLAMIGEAGKEAVMPLENNTGWIDNLAGQIAGKMGGNSSPIGGSKQPAQLNIYLDGVLTAQKFIDDINEMTKSTGTCPIIV
ncbi:MAG: hypothetical protein E7214_14945 [Clostridium sp.]|nr:hypothetical protein [Clostridium sp.]